MVKIRKLASIEKGLEELEEALPPADFSFLPRTPERRPRIEEKIAMQEAEKHGVSLEITKLIDGFYEDIQNMG